MKKMSFSFCSVILFAAVLVAASSVPLGSFGQRFHSLLNSHRSKGHGFDNSGFGGQSAHSSFEDGLYNFGSLNRHRHHPNNHYNNNENDCDSCGEDGTRISGHIFDIFSKGFNAFGEPEAETGGSPDLSSFPAIQDSSVALKKKQAQVNDALKGFGTSGLPISGFGADDPISSLSTLPSFGNSPSDVFSLSNIDKSKALRFISPSSTSDSDTSDSNSSNDAQGSIDSLQNDDVSLPEFAPDSDTEIISSVQKFSEDTDLKTSSETLLSLSDSVSQTFSGSQAEDSSSSNSNSNLSDDEDDGEEDADDSDSGSSTLETETKSFSSVSSSSEVISQSALSLD